jgi:hypothetical protein
MAADDALAEQEIAPAVDRASITPSFVKLILVLVEDQRVKIVTAFAVNVAVSSSGVIGGRNNLTIWDGIADVKFLVDGLLETGRRLPWLCSFRP